MLGAVLAITVAAAFALLRPDRVARIITGWTSHMLCSGAFVSHRAPDRVFAEMVKPLPGVGGLAWGLRDAVDAQDGEIRTTLWGAFESRAVYRDGFGCTLLPGGQEPTWLRATLAPEPPPTASLLPPIAGPQAVNPVDPGLAAALDRAFSEREGQPPLRTRSVVVVRDGRVVAERYAPGLDVNTPLLGFSATKSVINARSSVSWSDRAGLRSRVPPRFPPGAAPTTRGARSRSISRCA